MHVVGLDPPQCSASLPGLARRLATPLERSARSGLTVRVAYRVYVVELASTDFTGDEPRFRELTATGAYTPVSY